MGTNLKVARKKRKAKWQNHLRLRMPDLLLQEPCNSRLGPPLLGEAEACHFLDHLSEPKPQSSDHLLANSQQQLDPLILDHPKST